MTFSHDVQHALETVVDLVNTAPETAGQEFLPDVDALRVFVADHLISDIGALNQDDLLNVRAIRPKLRDIFLAEDLPHASGLVNDFLAKARLSPRLTNHDGYDWHIHYFAPGAALADHLMTDGGMALAFVVVAEEQERLRVCVAPDCRRVLVDLSRNRSKRYCDSRTCGNRLHVAAYRERRRAAS